MSSWRESSAHSGLDCSRAGGGGAAGRGPVVLHVRLAMAASACAVEPWERTASSREEGEARVRAAHPGKRLCHPRCSTPAVGRHTAFSWMCSCLGCL